jgi:anti-sigma factor RsiW
MTPQNNNIDKRCAAMQAQLTDYMDNRLSARDMWAVEKHLAECDDCSRLTHEITATVQLMQSLERRDTGDDFMAKLHARLDTVEPERARGRSVSVAIRDWLEGIKNSLHGYRAPALGLSVGMVALLALFLFPVTQQEPSNIPPQPPAPIVAPETVGRNVALSASNPFDDPAAANLQTLIADPNNAVENDSVQD